jgi:hypothetical protein
VFQLPAFFVSNRRFSRCSPFQSLHYYYPQKEKEVMVQLFMIHRFSLLFLPLLFPNVLTAPTLGPNNCTVFPLDHVWNTPIDCLPADINSDTYVNAMRPEKGLHAYFGAGLFCGVPIGIPYNQVPGSEPLVPTNFYIACLSDPGPYPAPLNSSVELGSGDKHLIVVDVDKCMLYEMLDAVPNAATGTWDAFSGAKYNLSDYSLRPDGWVSADSAGLAMFPGLVRYEEILKGSIDHAIRFATPKTQNKWVWPGRHSQGSLTNTSLPFMGQRFRLKKNFDISGFSQTNQIILKALKKYGMMVADWGGDTNPWAISGVPDDRWDNADLLKLDSLVLGSNFEAVNVSSLFIDSNSGKANQICQEVTPVSFAPLTTAPVPKPQKPVPKPAVPVPKPQKPIPKPAAPVPKPQNPIPKPAAPVPKPQNPIPKPAAPVPKPAAVPLAPK